MSLSSIINASSDCKVFFGRIIQRSQLHNREAAFSSEVKRLACQLDSCSIEVRLPKAIPSSALIIRPSMHMVPFISSKSRAQKGPNEQSVRTSPTLASWCHVPMELAVVDWSIYQQQNYGKYDGHECEDEQLFSSMILDEDATTGKLAKQEPLSIQVVDMIQTAYQFIVIIFYSSLFSFALSWNRDESFKE